MTQYFMVGFIVFAAASGAAIWYLDGKVKDATERAEQANSDLALEKQSREGFEVAATSCSKSVSMLESAVAAQKAEHEKRLKQSQAQTAQADEMVTVILSNVRPVGMSECEATFKELDDEIDRRAHEIDDRHPAQ